MRTRELAQVEPPERGVAELDEPQPEPVAAGVRTCSTSPPATSVASWRDAVLAFNPVRRAISFVPSSPSASASSTATARSTAAT